MKEVCGALARQEVNAQVTIDLLDLTGYGYYTGVGYAIYWNHPSIEVGRGGCYRTDGSEDALGFTLYINELLDQLPAEKPSPVLALPIGTTIPQAVALHLQGYVTMYADDTDPVKLKTQGFTHSLHEGKILPL